MITLKFFEEPVTYNTGIFYSRLNVKVLSNNSLVATATITTNLYLEKDIKERMEQTAFFNKYDLEEIVKEKAYFNINDIYFFNDYRNNYEEIHKKLNLEQEEFNNSYKKYLLEEILKIEEGELK